MSTHTFLMLFAFSPFQFKSEEKTEGRCHRLSPEPECQFHQNVKSLTNETLT